MIIEENKITYNTCRPITFTISDPKIYKAMADAADQDLEILRSIYKVNHELKTVEFKMELVGDFHIEGKRYDDEW